MWGAHTACTPVPACGPRQCGVLADPDGLALPLTIAQKTLPPGFFNFIQNLDIYKLPAQEPRPQLPSTYSMTTRQLEPCILKDSYGLNFNDGVDRCVGGSRQRLLQPGIRACHVMTGHVM